MNPNRNHDLKIGFSTEGSPSSLPFATITGCVNKNSFSLNPSQTQIVCKKIKNEEALNPNKADTDSKTRIVFSSRSRSKSTDFKGKKYQSTIALDKNKPKLILGKCNMMRKSFKEFVKKNHLEKANYNAFQLNENTNKCAKKLLGGNYTTRVKESLHSKSSKELLHKNYYHLNEILQESIKRKKMQEDFNKLFKSTKKNLIKNTQQGKKSSGSGKVRRGSQESISIKTSFKNSNRKSHGGLPPERTISEFCTVRHLKEKEFDSDKRISTLGLKLLYMKGMTSRKYKETSNENKTKETINFFKKNVTKKKIRNYINQKKDQRLKKKKFQEEEQRQRKERIDANKIKLNAMVKLIFNSSKKIQLQPKKSKRKNSKNKRKKSEERCRRINIISERIRSVSSSGCTHKKSQTIVKKIKDQLIREMSTRNPTDITEIQKFLDEVHNKSYSKITKSQSQPFLTQKTAIEQLSKENLSARKIQVAFKSYIERKVYKNNLYIPIENVNMEVLKSDSREEKIVHLSHINSIEEYKDSPSFKLMTETVAVNTEPAITNFDGKNSSKLEINIIEPMPSIAKFQVTNKSSSFVLPKNQQYVSRLIKSDNNLNDSLD